MNENYKDGRRDVELPKWVAIELACRIIHKFDRRIEFSEFRNSNKLMRILSRYKSADVSYDIATKVFDLTISGKGYDKTPYLKAFFNLNLSIRSSRQVVMPRHVFDGFVKYVGKKYFKHSDRFFISDFIPTEKQRYFEGRKYLIYFCDEAGSSTSFIGERIPLNVLSIGILRFGFSTVDFFHKSTSSGKLISRVGIYEVHDIDNLLKLEIFCKGIGESGKGDESSEDIKMVFNIDYDSTEVALGSVAKSETGYRNAIIRYDKVGFKNPVFLNTLRPFSSRDAMLVWHYIVDYKNNIIQTPSNITIKQDIFNFLREIKSKSGNSPVNKMLIWVKRNTSPTFPTTYQLLGIKAPKLRVRSLSFFVTDTPIDDFQSPVPADGFGLLILFDTGGATLKYYSYLNKAYRKYLGSFSQKKDGSTSLNIRLRSLEKNDIVLILLEEVGELGFYNGKVSNSENDSLFFYGLEEYHRDDRNIGFVSIASVGRNSKNFQNPGSDIFYSFGNSLIKCYIKAESFS